MTLRQQDKLVQESDNDSLGRHMMQMMEHTGMCLILHLINIHLIYRLSQILCYINENTFIIHQLVYQIHFCVVKLIKNHCRRNCNHLEGWMLRLMHFIDCCTFGVIAHDLIDFNEIKLQFKQFKKKMYHPKKTPQLEQYLLTTMPPNFKKYQSMIHKIGFKDPITPEIKNIWEQHLKFNKDKFVNMQQNDSNENESYMMNVNCDDYENDYSSQSCDVTTDDEQANLMTNMSQSQIFERMRQSTQEQYSQLQ